MWIRTAIPTQKPFITKADEDHEEPGYAITPSWTGGDYSFDRRNIFDDR
jgi:hypothetical protein